MLAGVGGPIGAAGRWFGQAAPFGSGRDLLARFPLLLATLAAALLLTASALALSAALTVARRSTPRSVALAIAVPLALVAPPSYPCPALASSPPSRRQGATAANASSSPVGPRPCCSALRPPPSAATTTAAKLALVTGSGSEPFLPAVVLVVGVGAAAALALARRPLVDGAPATSRLVPVLVSLVAILAPPLRPALSAAVPPAYVRHGRSAS